MTDRITSPSSRSENEMMEEPLKAARAKAPYDVVQMLRQGEKEGVDGWWFTMGEAADEIERLRTALEYIARDPGGIPGPRVFARDVLDGNIVLHPFSSERK
jgi:hypothetical protein